MSYDKQKVIDIAIGEVGYLEKASNYNLDSKTANSGSNNYTKYARDLDNIPGFYNGKKNGYAWCDCFVDWCFVQAYGVDGAKTLLCQPNNSLGAGCTYSAQYYKMKSQFYTSNPQPGDQIFFGNARESTHTGLVYAVDSARVYTVEGNTSGASGVIANGGGVCKKSYPLNYSGIYGYGRPNYGTSSASVNATVSTPANSASGSSVDNGLGAKFIVELNELKRGCKGAQVKALQLLLIGRGYSCGSYGADGDFGTGTYNALCKFQRDNGLAVDGEYGKNSAAKLIRG